jgi:hypothetical protein
MFPQEHSTLASQGNHRSPTSRDKRNAQWMARKHDPDGRNPRTNVPAGTFVPTWEAGRVLHMNSYRPQRFHLAFEN